LYFHLPFIVIKELTILKNIYRKIFQKQLNRKFISNNFYNLLLQIIDHRSPKKFSNRMEL